MQRTRFPIAITTVTPATILVKGDTGRLTGQIKHISWAPDTVDTGTPATVQLAICPDEGDTGKGFLVYSVSQQMGAVWDTGGDQLPSGKAFGNNDRLRLKVRPTDTGNVIAGALYVWSGEF